MLQGELIRAEVKAGEFLKNILNVEDLQENINTTTIS